MEAARPTKKAVAQGRCRKRLLKSRLDTPQAVPGGDSEIPESASGSTSGSVSEGTLQKASEAAACFLSLVSTDPEQQASSPQNASVGLLDFVPDKALDAVIAARKTTGEDGVSPLTFQDIIELIATVPDPSQELGLMLDSMAHRLLVLSPASSTQPLSSMLVNPGRSVHRYLVEASGEEAVVTIVLEHQDTLQSQYRSAPRISKVWRLRSVTAEPTSEDLPSSPSPAAGPEQVVQAQLDALKAKDVERVWEFAAPRNKAATGPLDNFARMLEVPQYRPLLAHSQSKVLKRCMHTADAYFELVAVTSSNTGLEGKSVSLVYLWDVKRQGPPSVGSWMTEGVQLISGAQVTRWPGMEDS
eukprot:CAMPEP_0202339990 /NCGR_PEP_ID=MMETSP1126-20121109/1614_1 /ASSEMBLY_ACC=CAM_ASM_000457 /TAXON_ID=3047 /ORGANISM="Dunaliella tertiolecta, Strain CCMP1320" /LENGTH=356 /DNA_ID=CAMNT_0048930617 /DNA_START=93 /DNA_END=1164 /DNA_ORIENTATION=+